MVLWEKFRALGSEAVLAIAAGDKEEAGDSLVSLKETKEFIFAFESRFSRFIAGNELDDFNRAPAGPRKVSEMFFDILEKGKSFHFLTRGIFDPTVISSLEELGYDRSFELIGQEPKGRPAVKKDGGKFFAQAEKKFSKRGRFADSELDRGKLEVSKPAGLRIDLGGIGKGFLADLAAAKIRLRHKNFWLSLGGDMVLSGRQENGKFWQFGVQNPNDLGKDLLAPVAKKDFLAAATSGVAKRRGVKEGFAWHHLIDPRIGLPSKSELLSVTVFADSAVRADVFAKTALILGREQGLEFIEGQPDCEAVVIDKNSNALFSSGVKNYVQI